MKHEDTGLLTDSEDVDGLAGWDAQNNKEQGFRKSGSGERLPLRFDEIFR